MDYYNGLLALGGVTLISNGVLGYIAARYKQHATDYKKEFEAAIRSNSKLHNENEKLEAALNAYQKAEAERRQRLSQAGRKGALAGNPKRKGQKRGKSKDV